MDGTVIGEFVCDKIWELAPICRAPDDVEEMACMDRDRIVRYLNKCHGWAWHISDLKIYDQPKSLSGFSRHDFRGMNGTDVCGNESCEHYQPSGSYMLPPTCGLWRSLARPRAGAMWRNLAMNNRRTAASIRRSYTGARSRAEGEGFESIIDNACAYYRSIGLADIEKTPEPMRPIGSPDSAGRFLACYTKQAQPDYKGVLKGGRAINFEAKHTDSDRLTFDRVLTAQALRLSRTEALGGIAFVLCSFSGRYFYRVPWAVWRDMKSLFGRKYITPADLAEYRVPFAAPGVLLFLEGVKEEKDDLHMCT